MTDSNDTLNDSAVPPQEEIWKDVPDFEGYYQVSNLGNVRRSPEAPLRRRHTKRGAGVLSPGTNSRGYPSVNLSKNGKGKFSTIHRIVALAFLGKCPEGMEINHKNGIKSDNRIENLEYISHKENLIHSIKELHAYRAKGEDAGMAKLTTDDVRHIRRLIKLGVAQREIAKRFGVTDSAIWQINKGYTWKHITDD